MAHCRRVELMKDVFTLIYPHLTSRRNPNGARNHEERRNRVQAWLADITQAIAQEESPWGEQERMNKCTLNLLPQFMQLLRECILTHQWTQVLTLLDCLSHIPYGADWTTWKASMAAFYTEAEDNTSLVQDFLKHAYLLQECNVRDVVLELIQYLLSQGLTQEASQAIQNSRKIKKGVLHSGQSGFTHHLIQLLDAYQGLIFYVDWKAAVYSKSAPPQSTLSQSFYSLTSSQGPSDEAIRSIAQRALLGLDSLPDKPGVWDIFLTKSVEIHEFYEEFEEARSVLRAYRAKNPDNPNAHRLLYEHLQRHWEQCGEGSVQEEIVSCLKGVVKLDPANPLVLTLWQKLTDQGATSQALCCVFDLLDYSVWRDRVQGWQCLASSLTTGLAREGGSEDKSAVSAEVGRCWASRCDWWPVYHFACTSLTAANSSLTAANTSLTAANTSLTAANTSLTAANTSLTTQDPQFSDPLLAKCVVASVLMGIDCCFIQKAKEMMDGSSLQYFSDTVSRLDLQVVNSLPGVDSGQCPAQSGATCVKSRPARHRSAHLQR